MNNRVFPIVDIKLTDGDDDFQRWPRSRQRAFKWAASERCLFMGTWPDSVVGEFPSLRNSHRVAQSCSWTPTVLSDLNKWEEVMPAHYTSDVLVQGRPVWNVLEPVARNTQTLYIIDPYLFSFDRDGNPYSKGLECLLEQNPSVFQAVMCHPNKAKLSSLAIKAISKWLLKRVGRSTSVTIFFAPKGSIHDRFLGFCDSRSSPKWLSISIGYGLTALEKKEKNIQTCVARIPSLQFEQLWDLSRSKSDTYITLDEDQADLGGDWYEQPEFDGFARAFHRNFSENYTGGR